MGKKRVKQQQRVKPQKKKARRVPIRKAKSKRNNSKAKKKKRKSTKSRSPARSKKSRATRTKLTGNSTRIKVDSRIVGKNITVVRKTTRFTPGIKIERSSLGIRKLARIIFPIAKRHMLAIGPSHKNYYYVRIQYHFKLRGEPKVSHFSIGIVRLKSVEQLAMYLQDLVESFHSSLKTYSARGFTKIFVTALIVQGYKK